MGIPRLIRRLEPYATTINLNENVKNLIIDGPGLVYHIYYRLLKTKDPSLNAIDATPSYSELLAGIIVFLLQIEKLGVHM